MTAIMNREDAHGLAVDWAQVDWGSIDFDTVDWEHSTNLPAVEVPKAMEKLTHAEACLAAILQDRSGIELVELVFTDDSPATVHRPPKSRAYRLYPYQWAWWRCMDALQIDQGARSLGKSESIIARACAFIFNFPGQEFVIVTPEGSHADALTERLEMRLFGSRFMREMLAGGRRAGVSHHPFQALFANGARVFVRLPQRSGIGVKGIHPVVLEVDEGQDISERTWKELPEVVRKEITGHMMRVHGVSKGVQDDSFFKKTQPDSGWTVHHLTKMLRPDLRPYTFLNNQGELESVTGEPTELSQDDRERILKHWQQAQESGELDMFTTNDTEEAEAYARRTGQTLLENWRDEQAREYGGRNTADFKRNVYGLHGEAMNRIFVLTRLMKCVDTMESSDYNTEEYRRYLITADAVANRAESRSGHVHDVKVYDDDQAAAIIEMVDLPHDHLGRYSTFWCGMDVGFIGDPSEILIFGEYVPKGEERRRDARVKQAMPEPGVSRFKLLTRIQLTNVAPDLQAHLIMHVIRHYKPKAFSLDQTGIGLAILRSLQRMAGTARQYQFTDDQTEDAEFDFEEERKQLEGKARDAIGSIKGYNFSEKIVVEINESIVEDRQLSDLQDILDQAGVRQVVKDAATDVLRELVDQQRLMLPYDGDVINQMNGQTWMAAREPVDMYGKSRMVYSRGEFHILDAARMFALGMDKQPIEAIQEQIRAPQTPVLARFFS